MRLLVKLVVNAIAIWLAAVIVPGVGLAGADTTDTVVTALVVGAIFGLVNAVIKPIVAILALPLYILSLGLITFVVNALLFALTAWIAGRLDLDFTVEGFVAALLGALVVSIVSLGLNAVVRD